jgi:hypothetical protein
VLAALAGLHVVGSLGGGGRRAYRKTECSGGDQSKLDFHLRDLLFGCHWKRPF